MNVVANTRNHRLNVQYIRANYSPASSAFGYYTAEGPLKATLQTTVILGSVLAQAMR